METNNDLSAKAVSRGHEKFVTEYLIWGPCIAICSFFPMFNSVIKGTFLRRILGQFLLHDAMLALHMLWPASVSLSVCLYVCHKSGVLSKRLNVSCIPQ